MSCHAMALYLVPQATRSRWDQTVAPEAAAAADAKAEAEAPQLRSGKGIAAWLDAETVIGLGFARPEAGLNEVLAPSLDRPIDASCRGHKLLLKMGWKLGTGA